MTMLTHTSQRTSPHISPPRAPTTSRRAQITRTNQRACPQNPVTKGRVTEMPNPPTKKLPQPQTLTSSAFRDFWTVWRPRRLVSQPSARRQDFPPVPRFCCLKVLKKDLPPVSPHSERPRLFLLRHQLTLTWRWTIFPLTSQPMVRPAPFQQNSNSTMCLTLASRRPRHRTPRRASPSSPPNRVSQLLKVSRTSLPSLRPPMGTRHTTRRSHLQLSSPRLTSDPRDSQQKRLPLSTPLSTLPPTMWSWCRLGSPLRGFPPTTRQRLRKSLRRLVWKSRSIPRPVTLVRLVTRPPMGSQPSLPLISTHPLAFPRCNRQHAFPPIRITT